MQKQAHKPSPSPLHAVWLGTLSYQTAYELQLALVEALKAGVGENVVLFLEHPTTITMGKGAHDANLLASERQLEAMAVSLHRSDRGGDVTLHAPGQLVSYPIVDLSETRRDVRKYVRALSNTMRHLIAPFCVDGGEIEKLVGLWVDRASPERWPGTDTAESPAKIGAIGVRISRWITMHGFALNLTTDLDLFRLIVPCGISSFGVTSIEQLTQKQPSTWVQAEKAHLLLCQHLGYPIGKFIELAGPLSLNAVLAPLRTR